MPAYVQLPTPSMLDIVKKRLEKEERFERNEKYQSFRANLLRELLEEYEKLKTKK